MPEWARKVRVGANSPSLWPTIDSEMKTGTCLRPSWTAIVWPTISGKIVDVRDQVRGLHIDKARALLQFSPRGAAHDIGKLIESAAANAENNHDLVADEMRVAEITVDEGPTLKRFRPRALGRATPIHKRTSHIAVALSPEED